MIKKAAIYFLIITALLYGFRYFHHYGLLKQTTGYYAKFKTAFLEKNKFNVLFLGSSRVEMHYDTQLFDSLTQQNSFNLSLSGATPHVAFRALKTYLAKSEAPAYLFYEVDYHSLNYKCEEMISFNNYFPFLSDPVFRKEFSRISPRMTHFYYNPYYSLPYVGLKNLSTGLHGWLNKPNKTDSLYYKGFFKAVLPPQIAVDSLSLKKMHAYFHVTERSYLDSIIGLCKKKNIQMALVSSPMYGGGTLGLYNKHFIVQQISNIARLHRIPYFDLSALPFCNNKNLFVETYHMSYAGAREFTPYISRIFNNKMAADALK